MNEILTYNQAVVNSYNYDPTRTTALRNAFAREMRRRFNDLTQVIHKTIVDLDCFGLQLHTLQLTPPPDRAFAFARSADKVSEFMRWLEDQISKGLLEVRDLRQVGVGVEAAWTNKYIFDSYKRGVIRARYEMQKARYDVPSIDQTGGIEISMGTPFHIDRLGLLYTRVFSELRNITTTMDTQISRILAQGIADGDNPRLLARKIVSTINGVDRDKLGLDISYITKTGKEVRYFMPAQRRAEIMARTEVIRAHHMATIQEYRNWALEGVIVKGEWKTAGDKRVCDECAELEGHVFSLDEIEKMIPLHPMCRCVALPWRVKTVTVHGGPGSGHFGHAGRPGEVGGSRSEGISDIYLKQGTDSVYYEDGKIIVKDKSQSFNIADHFKAYENYLKHDQQIYFYRATNNENEHLLKDPRSTNHLTGDKEKGLSVWYTPIYGEKWEGIQEFGGKMYMGIVKGKIIGFGSDKEPLLTNIKWIQKPTQNLSSKYNRNKIEKVRELTEKETPWRKLSYSPFSNDVIVMD